jgi:hypothetical protein
MDRDVYADRNRQSKNDKKGVHVDSKVDQRQGIFGRYYHSLRCTGLHWGAKEEPRLFFDESQMKVAFLPSDGLKLPS